MSRLAESTQRAAHGASPAAPRTDRHRSRRYGVALAIDGIFTAGIVVLLFAVDLDRIIVGLLVIAAMIGLMLLGIPIGIAMIVAAGIGLYVLMGERAVSGTLQGASYSAFASWSLTVIPMFILMGIALGRSGLSAAAFSTSQKWFGRLPGGLAIGTNFAGAGLAASSGSSVGITYALGKAAIPEMLRAGYRPSLATGAVAMSGTLGQVIPPSVLLVIYAGAAGVPIGPQLLAGILPGILLAVLFAVVILTWSILRPTSAPRTTERYDWSAKFASLVSIVPIALVVAVVIGGMYAGIFTATEAGAVGALLALVVGAISVMRRGAGSPWRNLRSFLGETFTETVSSVAGVFLLLVGVLLLTRVMALSGLAQAIGDLVVDLGLSQIGFLLCLVVVYLVLGFFLDTLAMILLTIPIFIGPLTALDVDLIWFGVFLIVLAEIDMVAPPFGVLNFVVHSIANSGAKEAARPPISIGEVFAGVTPFIVAAVLFLVALIIWPELATWLPSMAAVK